MKLLIVEDEELAVKNLVSMLKEIEPEAIVAGVCKSVRETVQWLQINLADLILLDIHLSDGLCFKIFEQIKTNIPVIITTAYDQFTIKAFELNSIDYLIKPIKVNDFKRALTKYKNLHNHKQPDYQKLIELLQQKEPDYQQRFLVNYGDKLKSIDVGDVAAFYIYDKSVSLVCFNATSYKLTLSLEQIEEKISPKQFFRISRQLIINHAAIENMYFLSNRSIKIKLKVPLPIDSIVSIMRLSEFKAWINA